MSINTALAKPYGRFVGGPVLGKRICTYEGSDGQVVILVDHPGDSLSVVMEGPEIVEQMQRAGEAKYIPPASSVVGQS